MGPGSIVLIAGAALLLFGPKKLPEIGRALGKTLRELKMGARELMPQEDDAKSESLRSEPRQGDLRDSSRPRQEFREKEINVQEAQFSEVNSTEAQQPEKKPQDHRRLPE